MSLINLGLVVLAAVRRHAHLALRWPGRRLNLFANGIRSFSLSLIVEENVGGFNVGAWA